MSQCAVKIEQLNGVIDESIERIKAFLRGQQIEFDDNATLRDLIALIPTQKRIYPHPLPTPLMGMTGLLWTQYKFIIAGGYNGENVVAEQYSWECDKNVKSAMPSLPKPVMRHTITNMGDGNLMYVGGVGEFPNSQRLNDVVAYNLTTQVYTTKPSMPSKRSSHTSIAKNQNVYICGGITGEGEGAIVKEHIMLSASGAYSTKTNYVPRHGHQAITSGNYGLYFGGAIDMNYTGATQCYRYAFGNNTWSARTNLSTGRSYFTVVDIKNSKLMISGGRGASGEKVNTNILYDINTNLYDSGTDSELTRSDMVAIYNDGMTFLLGGEDEEGRTLKYAECYERDSNTVIHRPFNEQD